jgi:hypothetical protein
MFYNVINQTKGDYKMNIDQTRFDLDEYNDVIDFLFSLGIDRYDVDRIVTTIFTGTFNSRTTAIEGLIGDDLYAMQEALASEVSEIQNEIGNLTSNARKGNTKAEIAGRLQINVDNLAHIANRCQIYSVKDL